MTFQKKHEYCWKPDGEKALDSRPLCFKLDADLKESIKGIPDWQQRLRVVLPELVDKWRSEIGNSSSRREASLREASPTPTPTPTTNIAQ